MVVLEVNCILYEKQTAGNKNLLCLAQGAGHIEQLL